MPVAPGQAEKPRGTPPPPPPVAATENPVVPEPDIETPAATPSASPFVKNNAPGIQEASDLQAAGFTDSDIAEWRAQATRDLQDGGFTDDEVKAYFGEQDPDMSATKKVFETNLAAREKGVQAAAATFPNPEEKSFVQDVRDKTINAVEAGWDMSVTGLLNKRPTHVLPEDAPMFYKIASQVGQLAGDVPSMIEGAWAGGLAGAASGALVGGTVGTVAAPGPGTLAGIGVGAAVGEVVGAGAGAFAAPEAMRTILMQHYEKGDVKDFRDFWERASVVAINSGKAGVIGGVTAGVGGAVGKVAAGVVAPAIAKTSVQLATEVGTMTTVGAALDGHMPKPEDFIEGAILVGGMHGALHVAGKARGLYAKTGVKPEEVVQRAQENPATKQALLSENNQPEMGEIRSEFIGYQEGANGEQVPMYNIRGEHPEAGTTVMGNEGLAAKGVEPPKEIPTVEQWQDSMRTVEPLTVYHGTFENFPAEEIKGSRVGNYGPGFYVTTDKIQAQNYGDILHEFKLKEGKIFDLTKENTPEVVRSIAEKHGLDISDYDPASKYNKDPWYALVNALREKFPDEDLVGNAGVEKLHSVLKEEGYQGVRFSQNGSNENVVVFDRSMLATNKEMEQAIKEGKLKSEQVTQSQEQSQQIPGVTPEVNEILSKVGEQAEKPQKKLTTGQAYTAFVDKFDPIHEAVKTLAEGKEIAADKNSYILTRMFNDYRAKAKHFFEKAVLDFKTRDSVGQSFTSILKSVENVDTLQAYAIAKRVIEKTNQGMVTGFNVETAKKVVEQNKAKYEKAFRQLQEFQDGSLKYLRDSGVISEEAYNNIKAANQDYIPFKRLMEVEEIVEGRKKGKAGSLKKFKGSERALQSPILSIVENTAEFIKMAEINRAKTALVEQAKGKAGQELIKEVPERMKPIKIHADELARELKNQGIIEGSEQAKAVEDMMIFRKQQMDLAPNQFAVFENGKRKVYETTPELAEALKRLDGDTTATNVVFKLMRGITTIKKFGITFTPDFIIKNNIRDWITGSVFTKGSGAINPLDIAVAMKDVFKKSNHYWDWMKSGGANGAFLELNEHYINKEIYKLQNKTNFLGSVRNVLTLPVDFMRVAAELSEQSIRVAEFKKVRKRGGSLTEAGYAAREVTVDFQRVGAKISALNSITAFTNVSIQGLDRTVRAFKENPTALTTRALTYITVPSLLLWWANKDDERYKQIPTWQKNTSWIILTDKWTEVKPEEADGLPDHLVREQDGKIFVNKGNTYRIPKPQELGLVFGSLPERVLDKYFGENPSALKDFDKSITDLIVPNFIPDAIAPAIEQHFNKSFFTGKDIVPDYLQKVQKDYQFVEYTSETAKVLGKMVATVDRNTDFASPLVLDNYIQSWGGALGRYAIQTADKALVKAGVVPDIPKPTPTLSDIPFVRSFVVRFPSSGSVAVTDFYDTYQKSEVNYNTIRLLAKRGDIDNLEKEMVLDANQEYMVRLTGIKEALSNQGELIVKINQDPDMSPDEKRQMIDGLYYMMIESAKVGNMMMREIKDSLEGKAGDETGP